MAETASSSKAALGWKMSGADSSSSDEDAIIPGVNSMGRGNLRPKMRLRRPREVRAKVTASASKSQAPETSTSTTAVSMQDLSQSFDERRLRPPVGMGGAKPPGQVSLKDLCVEDKKRIANLIRELAKVGEEREKAREELERERRDYEHQILKLVEQQEQILNERQEIEGQLQQCQQLLASTLHNPHHPPPPSAPYPYPTHTQDGTHPHPTKPQKFAAHPFNENNNNNNNAVRIDQFYFDGDCPNPANPRGENNRENVDYHGAENRGANFDYRGGENRRENVDHHRNENKRESVNFHQNRGENFDYRHGENFAHHQNRGDNFGYPPQGQSLLVNVGSPQMTAFSNPRHPSAPFPTDSGDWEGGGLRSNGQEKHAFQPAGNYFASALQKNELDSMSQQQQQQGLNRKTGGGGRNFDPTTLTSSPLSSFPPPAVSKEEIMNRFLADNEKAFASPKLRDTKTSTTMKDRLTTKEKDKTTKKGFMAPVMSSTQKSMDHLSVDSRQDYVPLVPDESSSDDERQGGDGVKRGGGGAGRVVFAETAEQEQVPRMHSPSGDAAVTDTSKQFRKMSQTQRKEQLLHQRAQLLQEQERLRHILGEQEHMLKEKQKALDARQHRHGNNQEEDEGRGEEGKKDDDPLGLVPQRLAIDAALERQRAIVDSLQLQEDQRQAGARNSPQTKGGNPPPSSKPSNVLAQSPKLAKNVIAKSKGNDSPAAKGRSSPVVRGANSGVKGGGEEKGRGGKGLNDIVKKLDYSLHSDTEERLELDDEEEEKENRDEKRSGRERKNVQNQQDEEEEEEELLPLSNRQDIGTSMSYRNIPRGFYSPTEQRTREQSDLMEQVFFASHPPPSRPAVAPGERTLAVLEIINSLPSPQPHHHHPPSNHPHHHRHHHHQEELSPRDLDFSPFHSRFSPVRRYQDEEDDEEEENSYESDEEEEEEDVEEKFERRGVDEDLEESQILEDIFFLK